MIETKTIGKEIFPPLVKQPTEISIRGLILPIKVKAAGLSMSLPFLPKQITKT